jgi:hypothetical protein
MPKRNLIYKGGGTNEKLGKYSNAYMIIINILNFWSNIAHYDSWSIGRKIGF